MKQGFGLKSYLELKEDIIKGMREPQGSLGSNLPKDLAKIPGILDIVAYLQALNTYLQIR